MIRRLTAAACTVAALTGPAAAHAAEPLPPVIPAQQQQAAPAAGSWDDVGRRSGLPFDSGVFAHDAFNSTPDGGKVDGYERVTGRPVDLYQIAPQREQGFGGLLSETDRIAKAMPDGVQVDWAFPLVSREEGAQLGTAICQATPNPYVRPGWEFNLSGSWDWTTDRIGDAAFVQGFRDSIDGIRSTCPGIRAEWNPNSGQGGVEKAMQAWPGDEYVDVIGVDTYDWANEPSQVTMSGGIDEWAQVARDRGKKLSLPEWGAHGKQGRGDNPEFVKSIMAALEKNLDVVVMASYFSEDEGGYIDNEPEKQMPQVGEALRSEFTRLAGTRRVAPRASNAPAPAQAPQAAPQPTPQTVPQPTPQDAAAAFAFLLDPTGRHALRLTIGPDGRVHATPTR